jgi:uncharacterized membrane protein YfcA
MIARVLAGGVWVSGFAAVGAVIWLLGATPRTATMATLALAVPTTALMAFGARSQGHAEAARFYMVTLAALVVLGAITASR